MRQSTLRVPTAILLGVLFLTCGVVATSLVASGAPFFNLNVNPSIGVPEQTVTVQGQSFEVTEIGRVESGQQIRAGVGTQPNTTYRVALYNSDRSIVDSKRGEGPGSFSLSTDGSPPGSYSVAVTYRGALEEVAPVVIIAYQVFISAPSSAPRGSSVTVSAQLNNIQGDIDVDEVELIAGDDDTQTRKTMNETSPNEYATSISLQKFEPDQYSFYVGVRGGEQVRGRSELIGLNSAGFEVLTPTPTPSPTLPDRFGDGSDPTDTSSPPNTNAPTPTPTPTRSPTPPMTTQSPTPTSSPSLTASPNQNEGTKARTETSQAARSKESVLTPKSPTNPTTPRTSRITTPGQGLNTGLTMVAIALTLSLLWYRRQ